MNGSRDLGVRESVYLGILSVGVAFMSTRFVVQVVHTGLTTAVWGDSVDATDPLANMLAMIAIASVVYNLLTKIANRHGLLAPLEGACWMVGLVPVGYWLVTKGKTLPPIDNHRYLGLFLVVGAICLGFLRYRLKKSTATGATSDSFSQRPTDEDRILPAKAINGPPSRQQEGDGRWGGTKTRRWMLVAAAGLMVAWSAVIPNAYPLWAPDDAVESVDICEDWYNAIVVPIWKDQAPLWAEWANALDAFVRVPARDEQLSSDIDAGVAPAELRDRRALGDKFFAAQDRFNVEVELTILDGHWDDEETRRVATASAVQMRALMDLVALTDILADAVDFPPFPDSEQFNVDLRRATLGLERACGSEAASH